MEPLTIFALVVGGVGVFHLLSTSIDRFGKGIYNYGNRKDRRSDWYCFFNLSQLLGGDRRGGVQKQTPAASSEGVDQRREIQSKRPRARL